MAEYTIIAMSDSHGDKNVVENIKSHYKGKVSAIFHNGDSELEADDSVWKDIEVVRGNCDYDSSYKTDNIWSVPGLTIAQTHGHLYQINFMWKDLISFAQKEHADICLYGHLHRAQAWESDNIVFINPGSVSQPRGDINERLYAKIIVTDKMINVDFMTLDHRIYPGLSKEFMR